MMCSHDSFWSANWQECMVGMIECMIECRMEQFVITQFGRCDSRSIDEMQNNNDDRSVLSVSNEVLKKE